MNHRWLTLLVAAFITAVVFLFFWVKLQPVWEPRVESTESSTAFVSPVETPTVTFVNPRKGSEQAKVTIVEFSDFQCQPCKELAENLETALRTMPEIQVVWKDLPNESLHNLSVTAAVAARCAANQKKFWEYHDLIFARQVLLSEEIFSTMAIEVGLDVEKFQTCFENQDTLPLVRKDYEEALALSLTATPTIFIGQERLTGLVSAEEIIQLAKTAIAK